MIQNTQNITYIKIIIHKITVKYVIYTLEQKHTKHTTKHTKTYKFTV
jgi:hypothetical protein